MKKIEAIIRPEKLPDVRHGLDKIGLNKMTIYHVRGIGGEESFTEVYRGQKYVVDEVDKIKIELFVRDEDVKNCVQAIMQASRTGEIGDGKIIVSPIDTIYRARSAEEGVEAL
jgi:nitrogen regulatory protein P-II 1